MSYLHVKTSFKINICIQKSTILFNNDSKQKDIKAKSTVTQEQLIEKLAQGKIDAETFREQTQSFRQQSKPITSIHTHQIQKALQNVMQQRFTLNILYPYIDEIHITKNKTLTGIYFKNEPLNIVNQTTQSSIA